MTKSDKNVHGQVVQVDAGKLAQGLKTTFEGVAMVFGSIGVDAGINNLKENPALNGAAGKAETKEEKDAAKETRSEDPVNHNTTPADTASDPEVTKARKEDFTAEKTDEQGKPEKEVPSITQDDITKVIVQKIKKDRSNNEKIGQILKTYGVVKVGELPVDKYEAFLTDIAEL